jgi:hypothetical protein
MSETLQTITEEDVFDLRIGLGDAALDAQERHYFDIAGYLTLPGLLSPQQVADARHALQGLPTAGGSATRLNLVAAGGVLEDAMALQPVLERVRAFIWGSQYRLVGSRGVTREPRGESRLSAGGAADARRYARYRYEDGQFRCLMLTCLIALDDTADDGAFCVVPSSHKANLPHPYGEVELAAIPPLRTIPLQAGSGVLFTESLSHAFAAASTQSLWLAYHYGPSYMVDWPGCEPSAGLRDRVAGDAAKSHLLLEPYYRPEGSQGEKNPE